MATIRRYDVGIEGLSPLLMHWDNIEWADEMDAWKADPANKNASRPGDDRSPAFRWIGSVYHDGSVLCLPADNLMTCMREGGTMVPVPGGRSGKTFKAQTQSGMNVAAAFCPLLVGGGTIPWEPVAALRTETAFARHQAAVHALGFTLFVKRAKVGTTKHIRVRPRFDAWSLALRLDVWDDQLTESVLRDVIAYAGQYKGLGDWRPGSPKSPGSYGMFKLLSFVRA